MSRFTSHPRSSTRGLAILSAVVLAIGCDGGASVGPAAAPAGGPELSSGGKPLIARTTEQINQDLPCQLVGFDFEDQLRGTIKATSMTFFDAAGNPIRAQIHTTVRSTETNSVTGKSVPDDEDFTVQIDFTTGKVSLVGAVSRVHVQGQGILIQDTGKITFVFDPDFHVIFEAGPHDQAHADALLLACTVVS